MSSELVKKLEDREQTLRENLFYKSSEEYDQGYIYGFREAMSIVETHEAKQMQEPFYQLDEEQQNRLERLRRKRRFVVSPRLHDMGDEQEKLEEEK
ncbi:hypothetical protein EZL62_01660 [Listeria monocytogenes]|nr:hypothetical protein [Listeria monocytogenes]